MPAQAQANMHLPLLVYISGCPSKRSSAPALAYGSVQLHVLQAKVAHVVLVNSRSTPPQRHTPAGLSTNCMYQRTAAAHPTPLRPSRRSLVRRQGVRGQLDFLPRREGRQPTSAEIVQGAVAVSQKHAKQALTRLPSGSLRAARSSARAQRMAGRGRGSPRSETRRPGRTAGRPLCQQALKDHKPYMLNPEVCRA